MGKATRIKQLEEQKNENAVRERLLNHNKVQIDVAKTAVMNERPLYLDLLQYQNKFFRDASSYVIKTKSKDVNRQLLELVRYTFGKYPVCAALTNSWYVSRQSFEGYHHERRENWRRNGVQNNGLRQLQPRNVDKIEFKEWYICVATGGSLYKEHAKEYLTKKEVHCFITCPHDISAKQAMIYAVAKAAGAAEGIALRVARTKLEEKQFDEFWRSVVRFFATHETQSINQINDLLDYINHEHTRLIVRQGEQVLNDFSMNGKTVTGLTKKMHDWHYELRRVKALGNVSWVGFEVDDQIIITQGLDGPVKWKFCQIKTSKDLAAEGNRMRHCVFSYKNRCMEGLLSIWSMQKETVYGTFEPKITIELRNDATIAQARGVANRSPKAEESHAINLWSRQNGFYFNRY